MGAGADLPDAPVMTGAGADSTLSRAESRPTGRLDAVLRGQWRSLASTVAFEFQAHRPSLISPGLMLKISDAEQPDRLSVVLVEF